MLSGVILVIIEVSVGSTEDTKGLALPGKVRKGFPEGGQV